MDYYEGKKRNVYSKLLKKGVAVVISRNTNVVNKMTGASTSGTSSNASSVGVVVDYKQSEIDDDKVKTSDFKILMAAWTPTGGDIAEPTTEDTLTMAGRVYKVVNSTPLRPGGVDIMYTVQCRA